METYFTTLLITFGIVLLALFALSIGWLLTGKSRIIRGACGIDPHKKKDTKCGKSVRCDLCKDEPEEVDERGDEDQP